MREGLSLEKTKNKLQINKKTAFDWRHKIATSLRSEDKSKFEGITESDETFFCALTERLKKTYCKNLENRVKRQKPVVLTMSI